MKVGQIDLATGTIRLNPGKTKNGKGRMAHMTPIVRELLVQCACGKQTGEPLFFTRGDGQPVRDFRGAWESICIASALGRMGCPQCERPPEKNGACEHCSRKWKHRELKYTGLIFHDLRRSAVREMVRNGVPEQVAMSISGHRTRSVFDRYNIVSESDLRQAAMKMHRARQHRQTAPSKQDANYVGQSLGRVDRKSVKSRETEATFPAASVLPN